MCSLIKFKVAQKALFKRHLTGLLILLVFGFVSFTASAQKYTILHTFGTNEMGLAPYGAVIQGPDGTLYGTTSAGGAWGCGQVFKVNPDGSGYTSLKDFDGVDCSFPTMQLLLSGQELYGTVASGGTNGLGAIFALNIDGSGYRILKQFQDADGGSPNSSLVLSGNTLFGTLAYGGSNLWSGAIFKINKDGSNYKKLYVFTEPLGSGWNSLGYTNADGSGPHGLLLLGNALYGTTIWGGYFGGGIVYKINTDGTGFTNLFNFDGTNGLDPNAGLVSDGDSLYGTTPYIYNAVDGGNWESGLLFRVRLDGSDFAALRMFPNLGDPAALNGDLVLTNSTLYGSSVYGGVNGQGTVFGMHTDGSGFTILTEFTNLNSVATPQAGLTLSGDKLFGTGWQCGAYGYGGIFKIQTDGSGYTNIVNFKGGDGAGQCYLAVSDSTIYGVTLEGGSSGHGTLFKIATDGTGYSMLKDFTNSAEGLWPASPPVVDGQVIYGAAQSSDGSGTLYKLNTDGTGYTVLKDFTNDLDGGWPCGALALSGSTLFGTTIQGGISNYGTVFRINTDGSGYVVLKHFRDEDGNYPLAGVVLHNGMLYGTTYYGGTNGCGIAFSLGTNGDNFTVLKQFTADWTGDGVGPTWMLSSDDTLYGICTGGSFGYGNLFKENTDGSDYSVIENFTNDLGGVYPAGQITLLRSTLYGTTFWGGKLDYGTVFQINTDGSGYAVLKQFTSDDGANPAGGLVLSGSSLYGGANSGGAKGGGVLFALSLLPEITVTPQSRTAEAGGITLLKMAADGSPPLGYQWLCNGTNLTTGCWTNGLELSDLDCIQSGTYVLIITNSFGAVTSAPVMLSVIPLVDRRPVPALSITGESGRSLDIQCADDLTTGNWMTLDTVSLTNISQFYFDASSPLPPQRFYRASQSEPVTITPSLTLPGMVPAVSLNGNIGDTIELDCINALGPTNAWTTLTTTTLTNTSQLYFDVSSLGNPIRLYRILSVH